MTVAGHDHSDPWMPERGSEQPEIEVPTPNSLPLSKNGFDVCFLRQSQLPRKADPIVRRPRTCSGAAPSGPCGPSCAGGSTPGVPIWSPCGRGTRECGCGACCGDGM